MEVKKMKYQYAKPCDHYKGDTRGANCIIETTWEEYFNAVFDKNYFTGNKLEFLKALKEDLERELGQVDEDIKKLTKTPKK